VNARLLLRVPGLVFSASVLAASAYSGEEAREIKALAPADVGALLSGQGMGLAKAAELNDHPGPAHVLELSRELDLTSEQLARTQALFESMSERAKEVGRRLVNKERQLDQLFATRSATPQTLGQVLSEIGALQAELRGIHLGAHLAQVEILSSGQRARYGILRGYRSGRRRGRAGASTLNRDARDHASTRACRVSGSAGLVRCQSKPASRARRLSSSCPQPVSAISRVCGCRRRSWRATS